MMVLGVHNAAGFSVFSPLPSQQPRRCFSLAAPKTREITAAYSKGAALGTTRLVAMSSEVKSAESVVAPMKSTLMRLLSKGTGLKAAAGTGNRAEVNELVLALEKNNPTNEPAASELLNGLSLSLSLALALIHTQVLPAHARKNAQKQAHAYARTREKEGEAGN